jgi:hypothetical protein
MKLDLSLVPYQYLADVVPRVLPYIKVSEQWTRGRSTATDLLSFIFSGRMQLWIVLDEQNIYGHLITEVKEYRQCKMFVIQHCAMEPHIMVNVEDKMQELAEKYAKEAGCAGIEFVGRPGWSKSMKKYGYDVQSVMFQKFFKDEK